MSFPRKEYDADRPKKYGSASEAKTKIAAYCAYQERCQSEVRKRLSERGVYGEMAEDLIAQLIEEGFLNEERFARSFARGKFQLKKWGKVKITQALKMRDISPYCIRSAMKEIDPEEYWRVLIELAQKRQQSDHTADPFQAKMKVYRYLLGRGFENDLVQMAVEEVFSGENL